MSVVGEAVERQDRRTNGEDDRGENWYQRVYLVVTDNTSDGAAIVKSATGLPQRGDAYETATEADARAIVVRREPRQLKKTPFYWEVTIRYEYRTAEEREKDPLTRQVQMSFVPEEEEVPITGVLLSGVEITPDSTRIYEKPLRNSLDQPFPTQPLTRRSNGILTIVRNEASFSPAWAMGWSDVANEDDWSGAVPRQLQIKTPTCPGGQTETVDDEEVLYYPVTYQITFREEGHDLRELDEGPDYQTIVLNEAGSPSTEFVSTSLGSTTHEVLPFVDGHGRPFIGKLDGHGRPLKSNPGFSTSVYTTLSSTVTGVFLQFPHQKLKPFGDLGLPEEFV